MLRSGGLKGIVNNPLEDCSLKSTYSGAHPLCRSFLVEFIMSIHKIDALMVRHAQPDMRTGNPDPHLVANQQVAMDQFEARLSGLIPHVKNIAVFSSPTRRTLETARLIMATDWVSERTVQGYWPEELAMLGDTGHSANPRVRASQWLELLNIATKSTLSATSEEVPSAMILVSHAPVIKDVFQLVPGADLGAPRYLDFLDVRPLKY